jgi:hypothetical protein
MESTHTHVVVSLATPEQSMCFFLIAVFSTKLKQSFSCSTLIDWCTTKPCSKGTCIQGTSNYYSCVCDPGWQGLNCTIDVNECLTGPCGSGSCVNTLGSYTCTCPTGFSGTNCQLRDNTCASFPCANGGICIQLSVIGYQ